MTVFPAVRGNNHSFTSTASSRTNKPTVCLKLITIVKRLLLILHHNYNLRKLATGHLSLNLNFQFSVVKDKVAVDLKPKLELRKLATNATISYKTKLLLV